MDGPHEFFGEIRGDDNIIFDTKNRADKISIILFGDYAKNEVLPLTPLFLAGRNTNGTYQPLKSFLEFYGEGGPNSWTLNDVGGDLQAEDILSHPYESVIGEIDALIKVLNAHLQRSTLTDASQVASQIIQLLRLRTPQYSIKHSS